jgi:type II secretory pathway pseudopilin PulG
LVVILILAILIAVAAPSFLGQTQKANDSAAKQQLAYAYKAAVAYAVDGNGAPGHVQGTFDGFDASALEASEPELTGHDSATCPGAAIGSAHNQIYIQTASGHDLTICNDPEGTVCTLTVSAAHPSPSYVCALASSESPVPGEWTQPASDVWDLGYTNPNTNTTAWYSPGATSVDPDVDVTTTQWSLLRALPVTDCYWWVGQPSSAQSYYVGMWYCYLAVDPVANDPTLSGDPLVGDIPEAQQPDQPTYASFYDAPQGTDMTQAGDLEGYMTFNQPADNVHEWFWDQGPNCSSSSYCYISDGAYGADIQATPDQVARLRQLPVWSCNDGYGTSYSGWYIGEPYAGAGFVDAFYSCWLAVDPFTNDPTLPTSTPPNDLSRTQLEALGVATYDQSSDAPQHAPLAPYYAP